MQQAFLKFFRDIGAIFSGRNLIWHGVAIGATYLLVISGFDWWVTSTVRGSAFTILAAGGGSLGFLVPVVLPLCMLAIGWMRRTSTLVRNGWLLAQAEITALLLSFLYKMFTGRPGPHAAGLIDTSHVFQFGFLRGGVFWGWPSSHIVVAVAGMVALMVLYRHNAFIKYLALAYAIYIGLSVSVTFHWFSDGVAAAIFGILVGLTVAKGYTKK